MVAVGGSFQCCCMLSSFLLLRRVLFADRGACNLQHSLGQPAQPPGQDTVDGDLVEALQRPVARVDAVELDDMPGVLAVFGHLLGLFIGVQLGHRLMHRFRGFRRLLRQRQDPAEARSIAQHGAQEVPEKYEELLHYDLPCLSSPSRACRCLTSWLCMRSKTDSRDSIPRAISWICPPEASLLPGADCSLRIATSPSSPNRRSLIRCAEASRSACLPCCPPALQRTSSASAG